MARIAVIGGGGWGTALASLAGGAGHEVCLWARNASVVDEVNSARINGAYLPGHELPAAVRATADLNEALERPELIVWAVPSHATRALLSQAEESLRQQRVLTLVSATKGIEAESGKRVSEIVCEVLGEAASLGFVCLTGPSFAREVVAGQPTAVVAAGRDASRAASVQQVFGTPTFRVYTHDDVAGAELGGAVKNVMALAAGMAAGLGVGANGTAALVTRGLAEMTRLALAAGGRVETLMGLAGLGDLVLTCTGELSRNRRVGFELGRGRELNNVLAGTREVAEGVRTARAVKTLAVRLGVEMPITEAVNEVLYEGAAPREAVAGLMSRPQREEFYGLGGAG